MPVASGTPVKRPPPLPPLPGGMEYLPLTQQLWESLFDERQAEQLQGAQMMPAIRWIRAVDDWLRALDQVTQSPMVAGSMGQPVANPMMSWVASREAEMEKCEKQLGIGLKNKADLGLTFGQMRVTAQTLIEMHHQQGSTSGDDHEAGGAQAGGEEDDGWTAG